MDSNGANLRLNNVIYPYREYACIEEEDDAMAVCLSESIKHASHAEPLLSSTVDLFSSQSVSLFVSQLGGAEPNYAAVENATHSSHT